MTYQDFNTYFWQLLNIDNRSITFHIVDSEYGITMDAGIVDTPDDLYDTDFIGFMMDDTDASTIEITSVESWILGNGESERVDDAALKLLQDALEKFPDHFDRFIREHADPVGIISDFTLDNLWYEPDDDDDWDDNDADLDD